MIEKVMKYPSPVARPYILIKDNQQKKDMQRFWFENTMSFLASIVGSELVNWYRTLKEKDNKTEKDINTIKMLQNIPALTNVGLEQMSLGKWVMMLRETSKVLKDNDVPVIFPELLDFYDKEKEVIDRLVIIRNNDAHGNPIPEDKLYDELNKRQVMIDKLINSLSFLENYVLLFPERIEIEGKKQLYVVKEFTGNSIITAKRELNFPVRLNDLILVNKIKQKSLSLLPNVVYLGVFNDADNFIGIFSKFVDKERKIARYIDLEGSTDIDHSKANDVIQIDLLEERKHFYEIYSNPEDFKVNLDINLEFEEESIKVNEESSFFIKIDNTKSSPIKSLSILLEVPSIMEITYIPTSMEKLENAYIDRNRLVFELSNIEDEKIIIDDVRFRIGAHGYLTFKGFIIYKYYKTQADKDADILTTEELEFSGSDIEVIDPASKDKILPVINVYKRFLDTNGNPVNHVKIGENFVFEVKVINIGFSSARDVSIDIVIPEGLSLREGKESIRVSQLNPLEEKVFQYIFSSTVPDIYNIAMQNILYHDINGRRYFTQCSDNQFIIVKSDILTEFKLKIKEFIQDLYIDEVEKAEIKENVEKVKNLLGIDAEKFYKDVEFEAVVNILRGIVHEIAKKRKIKVVETVYKETKRDMNFLKIKKPRKFLTFLSNGFAFFAIDLESLDTYGLATQIHRKFSRVIKKRARVDKNQTLEYSVDYPTVRDTKEYSVPFFKQWVNMILSKLEKEYFVWKAIVNKCEETFNRSFARGVGDFYDQENYEINVFKVPQRPNYFIIAFSLSREESTNNYKQFLSKADVFVARSVDKEYMPYDETNNRLSHYWVLTDRVSTNPGVMMKVRDSNDVDLIIEKAKKLYKEIQYIKSLNMFNENEEMKKFVTQLFKRGFILRPGKEKYEKDKINIVNIDDYLIDSLSKDAIAYVEISKKGMDFYLRAYSNIYELKEYVSIRNFGWTYNKPLYLLKILHAKNINKVFDYILRIADEYDRNKLFVWPQPFQRELIENFASVEYGVYKIFLALSEGKKTKDEIIPYFPNEREFDRFLQRNNQLQTDYKTVPIFDVDEEIIAINEPYLETYEVLKKEKDFNILEEGIGLYRLVSLELLPLLDIKLYPGYLWASKTFSVKGNDLFKKIDLSISYVKGKKLRKNFILKNVSNVDKLLETIDRFDFDVDVNVEVSRTSKNQQINIISRDYLSIENIEKNKFSIASSINKFFREMNRFLEQFEVSILT